MSLEAEDQESETDEPGTSNTVEEGGFPERMPLARNVLWPCP